MANRKKRSRQRIDTMIDAHVWMRRQVRLRGEWNGDGLRAPPKKVLSALWSVQDDDDAPSADDHFVVPAKGNDSSSTT
jgi:hypothetical protein